MSIKFKVLLLSIIGPHAAGDHHFCLCRAKHLDL